MNRRGYYYYVYYKKRKIHKIVFAFTITCVASACQLLEWEDIVQPQLKNEIPPPEVIVCVAPDSWPSMDTNYNCHNALKGNKVKRAPGVDIAVCYLNRCDVKEDIIGEWTTDKNGLVQIYRKDLIPDGLKTGDYFTLWVWAINLPKNNDNGCVYSFIPDKENSEQWKSSEKLYSRRIESLWLGTVKRRNSCTGKMHARR